MDTNNHEFKAEVESWDLNIENIREN